MDWPDFIARFGLPMAMLAAIAWFTVARVWPFIVDAYNSWHEDRKIERQEFLEAISEERKAFRDMVDVERTLRIQERDRFLEVLERQRQAFQSTLQTQSRREDE